MGKPHTFRRTAVFRIEQRHGEPVRHHIEHRKPDVGALTGAFAPVADVGVFVADGQGKLSGSDTISDGGQIIPRTFTGTYTINSDCRGTAALQFTPSLAVDIALVLDDQGHEARALQTTPQGTVFTIVARNVH